jgi:signal transduction histidine kinase
MNKLDESLLKSFTILLVDDVPDNLKVLGDLLVLEGYKVLQVSNGEQALRVAEKEKPGLILLDIMMPGMDGFEVCRRLKENEGLRDIPVLFISALNETGDIVKALNAGGVDYINKPFRAEEVKARVGTHLMLYRQSKELQKLVAEKDKFFSIIAHDLRGPSSGFMALSNQLADESRILTDIQRKKMTTLMNHSAKNTYKLLENLLQWSKMVQGITTFSPERLNLKILIGECVNLKWEMARAKNINLAMDVPDDLHVFADDNMIKTVIRNLLSNGIKFTPDGGNVTIFSKPTENKTVVISVKDTGIGMDLQLQENLFRIDTFNKRLGTSGEQSTGLGLILCKEFVEKHGGSIWIESVVNQGSVFSFDIPD